MRNLFNSISSRRPKRNVFDLSHEVKLSTNMGRLTPILCEEVVPGDKFRGSANALVRLAPMLAPMMHHVNVYTHFFFVPNRIIWNEWEDFITGGKDGTANPVFPRLRLPGTDFEPGTLADYLGIGAASPTGSPAGFVDVSALPFRAYQLIYNEYYRDQNLTDEIDFSRDSGIFAHSSDIPGDVERLLALRNRAWEKDYFTSALPWAQRGAEVQIPVIGQGGNVYLKDSAPFPKLVNGSQDVDPNLVFQPYIDEPSTFAALGQAVGDGTPGIFEYGHTKDSNGNTVPRVMSNVKFDPNGSLGVDLTEGTGTTVNEFRRSIRIQEWLEKNARGGARYIEQILSHFGVTSSDARLQRPEFLGGGKSPIVISEVLQTSSTDSESPQANMAGHGISAHGSHMWNKNIEEHGYIIGIMSVLPRTAYQQGVPRHFRKFDKFDYYWPELAHLGEQPIYQSEIYNNIDDVSKLDDVFGYTPRYAEYKYCPSRVHGDFKDTLSFWHMGRIFGNEPALNTDFVTSDPTQRIFAVDDDGSTDKLWIMIQNNVLAVRPMPKYGTPTI